MGKETRRDLERAIGRLPNTVWQSLVEDKFVEMHDNGTLDEDPETSWELLKQEAQKRVRFAEKCVSEALEQEKRAERGSTHHEDRSGEWRWVPHRPSSNTHEKRDRELEAFLDFFLFLNPKNKAMLQATSKYFERLADRHPGVVRFRSEVLGGRILASHEARKLLGCYAARFFPHDWFLDWEIPVVGHVSEIVGEYDWSSYNDEVDHRVTVWVDPPGVTRSVRYAHPDTPMNGDPILTSCVLRSGEILPPIARSFLPTRLSKQRHRIMKIPTRVLYRWGVSIPQPVRCMCGPIRW